MLIIYLCCFNLSAVINTYETIKEPQNAIKQLADFTDTVNLTAIIAFAYAAVTGRFLKGQKTNHKTSQF